MYQKQTKKGFFLFEIMLGLVIFSMSCLFFAWQRWELIKQEQEAMDRLQALSLGRNAIENICTENKFSLPPCQTKNKFTITVQQNPLSLQIDNKAISDNFKLIEVIVTWQSTTGKRSVKLVTGLNVS